MSKATIENIGPWSGRHEFDFQPGINVLQAPNGRGKTIFLQSMMALASGEGRLPLHDGAKKGLVEGFGARITVGAACRHMGEFELENLEGKLSIAKLVDPGLKTGLAQDRQRIKALATLMGCKATLETFAQHPAFQGINFHEAVGTKAGAMTDLCEMADQVARDFQAAARIDEDMAKKFLGMAAGLEEAAKGVDLEGEDDPRKLQEALETALQQAAHVTSRAQHEAELSRRREEAKTKLAEAKARYDGPTVEDAEAKRDTANAAWQEAVVRRHDLEEALSIAKREEEQAKARYESAVKAAQIAKQTAALIAEYEATINAQAEASLITADDIRKANEAVAAARVAVELGTQIRKAKENKNLAQRRREDALVHQQIAERLREAGKATDLVLSDAIRNPHLRVESVDDVARLVVSHPVRGTVPYEDLSAGERWRIAIDLAADLVGEGGLLVIDQEGWEGIDAFERPKLHAHAIERKVIIVTAEATRDVAEGEQPRIVHFSEAVAA